MIYHYERLVEDSRVRHYKWEFLRRNEDYREEYAKFAGQFPDWISPHGGLILWHLAKDAEPEVLSFFRDHVEPAVRLICEHWDIDQVIDPSVSDTELSISFYQERYGVPVGPVLPEHMQSCVRDYFSSTLGDAPHTPEGLRFVNVRLDIAQPLETLFGHLEIFLVSARARYNLNIGQLPEHRKKPRARLKEYENYLRVWDLRRQSVTFERIAAQLFPRQMNNSASRSAAIKRVRSQFQRAQKLIAGEYRQIEG